MTSSSEIRLQFMQPTVTHTRYVMISSCKSLRGFVLNNCWRLHVYVVASNLQILLTPNVSIHLRVFFAVDISLYISSYSSIYISIYISLYLYIIYISLYIIVFPLYYILAGYPALLGPLPLYFSLPIRYSFLPSLPRITRLRP